MSRAAAELAEPIETSLRGRILRAAFEAFMEHGYFGASTLDIATRARVSKRDIYAQFGSKQAMLAACIAARTARMRLPLDLPAPRNLAGLAATLVAFGATLVREVARPEVLATHRLAILEAERAPDMARTLDELGRAATHAALAKCLADAQAAGLLGPGRPEEMAETFLAVLWSGGLLLRLLLRLAGPPDEAEAERRACRAADAVLRLYAAVG